MPGCMDEADCYYITILGYTHAWSLDGLCRRNFIKYDAGILSLREKLGEIWSVSSMRMGDC